MPRSAFGVAAVVGGGAHSPSNPEQPRACIRGERVATQRKNAPTQRRDASSLGDSRRERESDPMVGRAIGLGLLARGCGATRALARARAPRDRAPPTLL